MFLFWRIGKLAFKLALLLVLAVAAFAGWALLWPAPHVTAERCPHGLHGCIVASGRVLYHTAFSRNHAAHVVLLSSRSVTLPLVVVPELPAHLSRAPAGLGFGDWVSVSGPDRRGSHAEHEIRVLGLATTRARLVCGSYDTPRGCRTVGAGSRRP